MVYFVRARDGKKYGPVTLDTLNRWAAEGRIGPSTTIEGEDHDQVLAFALPGLKLRDCDRPVTSRAELDWSVAGSSAQVALGLGYEPLIKPAAAETHLIKNVIHLVIGCLPITLLALVFSWRTDQQNRAGQFDQAAISSDRAKFWGDVSLLTMLGLFLVWLGVPMIQALRDWH
ncbi:MAG: CD225/dispanin family protein [Chthonomonas sp.]|nr:CD225/dispanin family protein [Chthonomonas sp.]